MVERQEEFCNRDLCHFLKIATKKYDNKVPSKCDRNKCPYVHPTKLLAGKSKSEIKSEVYLRASSQLRKEALHAVEQMK
jgi:hypothetical protein